VDELVTLFEARRQDVAAVAALADELRRGTVGETVTWVHNRNIDYANVCTFQVPVLRVLEGPRCRSTCAARRTC
jgi:FO synthase